jgi:PleD family two-component response regulator
VIGIVEVINKIGAETFDQDDLNIFETMVEHATIALQNASLYRQIEQMTVIDDLTKLYNTRFCNQYLEALFFKSKVDNSPISLVFLDVDHFKNVNDVSVRFGGDEYIVILPRTTKKTAMVIAETIRQEVCKRPFKATDRKTFYLTVTVGLASFPDDASNKEELIGMADHAMYEGKETGRNRVIVAGKK